MIRLAEISIFPVKSLRGATHDRATVEPCGLAGDRRWLVVRPDGTFITQREVPRMALIDTGAAPDGLLLRAAGQALDVPVPPAGAPIAQVTVWRDTVAAAYAGDTAAAFLSAALGIPCRLVYLADQMARPLAAKHAQGAEFVSFADGFPVLLASTASLANLNRRMEFAVPMLRFRPNLVIDGALPWAEDAWRRIRIGRVVFRVSKPCDRCVMTTIDPATGLRPNPVEPIRTLGRFRRDARGGVMFGQNLVPETEGVVSLGDAVELLETGPPNVQLVA